MDCCGITFVCILTLLMKQSDLGDDMFGVRFLPSQLVRELHQLRRKFRQVLVVFVKLRKATTS